ncbi:GGDEF domain-containing protein [Granulicella arctica]|uniref:GGDEF domain-containing protein n=1 Tax=Granulicella arctica TaxID=940613 RepID=UPI0021E00F9A|nr:GGDEF domain-containing protein [Granulicella arctica]
MKRLAVVVTSGCFALVLLGLTGTFEPLFSANYLPHRYCYLAKPELVWTNVITDGLIALSYAVIFGCLMWMVSKLKGTPRLRPYLWILLAFGTFIFACGATHVMEVITVWVPVYPLAAAVKVVAALTSIPTAILFARTTPRLAKSLVHFLVADSELQQANKDLLELSARDALTDLNNRRRFEGVLATEWQRSTRQPCSLALLMIDVDHFKMLNDRYGHLAGDECLRRMGQVFSSRKWRAEDVIARYGGEEFALLLPGSDCQAAAKIGEELRLAVMELQIKNENSPVAPIVTISIGVASRIPEYGQDPRELLGDADAALYRAKDQGRNQVACTDPYGSPDVSRTTEPTAVLNDDLDDMPGLLDVSQSLS